MGIGHGAWGMGHRALGIGHRASGIGHYQLPITYSNPKSVQISRGSAPVPTPLIGATTGGLPLLINSLSELQKRKIPK